MTWHEQTQSIPLGTHGSALFRRRLRLDGQDAKSHMHVMGKSGSGKSRWLAGFYVNLLRACYGLWATTVTRRCNIRLRKARKCKPATTSGKRS
jgi:hypothetical protein